VDDSVSRAVRGQAADRCSGGAAGGDAFPMPGIWGIAVRIRPLSDAQDHLLGTVAIDRFIGPPLLARQPPQDLLSRPA
jgi:hypothetical protein